MKKEHRRGAHTVFEIHLPLVGVTKYRQPVLVTDVGLRVRDLIRPVCPEHEVTIMTGPVSSKDPVPLLGSIPPPVTLSRLVQGLKGKSAYKLLPAFPLLQKKFWGRHMWVRGYFCWSRGNVTDAVMMQYIEHQTPEGVDDDFRVEGEAL